MTNTEDNANDGVDSNTKDHLAFVVNGHMAKNKDAIFLEAFSTDHILRPGYFVMSRYFASPQRYINTTILIGDALITFI